jgi:hypothetical protein
MTYDPDAYRYDTMSYCKQIALERKADHNGGTRNLGINPFIGELAGVIGEHDFGQITGLPWRPLSPGNDGGRDFLTGRQETIDVKTESYASSVMKVVVQTRHPYCDIYVMGEWQLFGLKQTLFHGWATRDMVLSCKIEQNTKGGPWNYQVYKKLLLPMNLLYKMIANFEDVRTG